MLRGADTLALSLEPSEPLMASERKTTNKSINQRAQRLELIALTSTSRLA